jgi:DNA repair photolyase
VETPFTPFDFVCDTARNGGIVEHTTSWLTVNPVVGCPLECAYCFRHHWSAPDKVHEVYTPQEVAAALESHREFHPHVTPLAINVSSTDAFLPAVRRSTVDCLMEFERRQWRNIVGLITKCEITDSDASIIANLSFIRPIVFVSLALIPREIEPVPVAPRLRTMQRLRNHNIPVILYYRPIVAGWNDSADTMRRVLGIAAEYANAICYGGLHLSPEIVAQLQARNITFPISSGPFHEKEISSDIGARLEALHHELGLELPLYKHTSCAVSYCFSMENYNKLARYPDRNCTASCPTHQQALCRRLVK